MKQRKFTATKNRMKSSLVDQDTQKEKETDLDKGADTTLEENMATLEGIIAIQLL